MTTNPDAATALILVVDDDVMAQTLIKTALIQNGHEVIVAGNGVEAVRLFDESRPELVLMDADMPEMNGFEACAALKRHIDPIARTVPVIMVTALEVEEAVNQAFAAGAEDFVLKPVRFTVLLHRISLLLERQRAQAAVLESEERFRAIAQSARDSIISIDQSGTITFSNKAADVLFAGRDVSLVGRQVSELMPEMFRGAFFAGLERFLETGEKNRIGRRTETVGLRPSGGEFPVEMSLSTWRAGKKSFFTAILRDITERKADEARIQHLASHDQLTGLPNRMLFHERLAQELTHAKRREGRLGVMFMDLDHFKAVNDALGHEAGDQLLVEASQRIKSCLRESDSVARMGGDEFTALLPEVADPEDVVMVGRKIIEQLIEPFQIKGHTCTIGASIGISLYPDHGDTPEELIKTADSAMYRVKKKGKNDCLVYTAPH